jgi:hypothetical protein
MVSVAVASSAIEFHAPQESHRPCQRECTAPQIWQMKDAVRFAMGGLFRFAVFADF